MGEYDDISESQLRADLVRFAELILRLEEEEGLLSSPADLQTILGELRQKLFAWEIRCSRHLKKPDELESPEGEERSRIDPDTQRSLKVVREALRREEEMLREWGGEGSDSEPDD